MVEFPYTTEAVELFNCVGFSIPKIYEWKEEVHNYGNMSQKFLIPKVDILPTVTIELLEYINDDNDLAVRKILSNIDAESGRISYSNAYNIKERYNASYRFNSDDYNDKKLENDLNSLTIKILNNKLTKCIYAYRFTNLIIIKAEPYEFSYEDDGVCKWTISFISTKMEKIDYPDDSIGQI
jgi:hypothetical protein